ncbi:META domain-containing protein [Roseobacter denitrificans]|uniref:DUF306 domain-containing protein n=1 Tax=Roseobacter denitrificans (strain ATCC 33942 / OCh 114) TaxID=375451 RepID=Q16DK8_ROSDO|nr:META domain-containing protein [Roseobacter denitrificans]ABG29935.1 conserved hypothetical protein [Roseobacter denitrificans OCh 114]AVL53147.1 META domain-containing protein [Roseobacter denitrificans]SFG38487.1 Heat shock protein HslJ [Roseobacter denitrificans OCh 114]
MAHPIKHAMAATLLALGGAAQAEMLPGSEWEPTKMQAQPFESARDVFIRFEQDGRYFGNGGCNSIRGRFVTNGDAILLGPAAATMMACPEEIMQQEFGFLQTLDSVRQFDRSGTELTLSDAAARVVMRLRQRDWD